MVRVFDVTANKTSYTPTRQISDPTSSFVGGLSVAVGDVNGDGLPDIITGAGAGGSSYIRIYDGKAGASNSPLYSFRAFTDASSTAAVRVTARDVDGDGLAEIFAAQGPNGQNNYQVKRFKALSGALVDSFFATNSDFSGGGLFLG